MRAHIPATLALALLLMMFLLAGGAASNESVTFDEVAHIGAGLSAVQKLDLRFNDEHPPLAKVLAGIPLALAGTRADYAGPQWTIGTDFFSAHLGEWIFGNWVINRWNNPRRVLMLARLPMLLLTVLLGWVLFVQGRRFGGPWGGVLCVAVYATMPAFLTFGPLVLTDVAISIFALLTLWTLGELWRNPDRQNIRWFGLALAGALLSKFSSSILLIGVEAFVLSTRWWPVCSQPAGKAEMREWRRLRWRGMRRGAGLAAMVVYAAYFFLSWNQPVDIPGFAGHGLLLSAAGKLLMPPWIVLRGLGWVLLTSIRPAFLLGHEYPHGVWFYFPVLLVLKSLPGFLGLLLLALALAVACRTKFPCTRAIPIELSAQWRGIWVSLLVFTGVCLVASMDISIRHFTVPLVLLILLLAPLPNLIERSGKIPGRLAGAATLLLVASCLFTAVRLYPYYMQYASPIAVGSPLYWLMSDSNVDWNQSLPEVGDFAKSRGLMDVPLDAYGFADPTPFVPHARPWDCQSPADSEAGKWAFVSANLILDSHNCKWILQYPHQPMAAGSVYAVQLPAAIPAAGSPGGPPAPGERRVFLGGPLDIRAILRELSEHPERAQTVMQEMAAEWRKSQEAASRPKSAN